MIADRQHHVACAEGCAARISDAATTRAARYRAPWSSLSWGKFVAHGSSRRKSRQTGEFGGLEQFLLQPRCGVLACSQAGLACRRRFSAHPEVGTRRRGFPTLAWTGHALSNFGALAHASGIPSELLHRHARSPKKSRPPIARAPKNQPAREAAPRVPTHVVRERGGRWDDASVARAGLACRRRFSAHPKVGTRRRGFLTLAWTGHALSNFGALAHASGIPSESLHRHARSPGKSRPPVARAPKNQPGREAAPRVPTHVVRERGGWWDDASVVRAGLACRRRFSTHPKVGTRRRGFPTTVWSGARAF